MYVGRSDRSNPPLCFGSKCLRLIITGARHDNLVPVNFRGSSCSVKQAYD